MLTVCFFSHHFCCSMHSTDTLSCVYTVPVFHGRVKRFRVAEYKALVHYLGEVPAGTAVVFIFPCGMYRLQEGTRSSLYTKRPVMHALSLNINAVIVMANADSAASEFTPTGAGPEFALRPAAPLTGDADSDVEDCRGWCCKLRFLTRFDTNKFYYSAVCAHQYRICVNVDSILRRTV